MLSVEIPREERLASACDAESDTSDVIAEQGEAIDEGSDGVAVTLAPPAAEEPQSG